MYSVFIQRFIKHLRMRNYSPHTLDNYSRDLNLFFTGLDIPLASTSFREVERFIENQYQQGLAPSSMNRRLNALKHFFDFLIEQHTVLINPVKPSHFLRRAKTLPKALSQEQVQKLFTQIQNPLDKTLFLLMLRGGLRVSEVAALKRSDIDWENSALIIHQGKGRKDRRVYLSEDALSSLKQCIESRPPGAVGDFVFWNQKRKNKPLSIKAIQKKMERYARAAGVTASCHSLRHTFASNLLEHGTDIVSIKEFLGHDSIASSERYARLSNQKVKQAYLEAMKKIVQTSKV
jgi:site-specific recombinase XerD